MKKKAKPNSCDCIEEVQELLRVQNEQIVISFNLHGEVRTVVATEKRDPTIRLKRHTMVASFCPFCGRKYVNSVKDGTRDKTEQMRGRIKKLEGELAKLKSRHARIGNERGAGRGDT